MSVEIGIEGKAFHGFDPTNPPAETPPEPEASIEPPAVEDAPEPEAAAAEDPVAELPEPEFPGIPLRKRVRRVLYAKPPQKAAPQAKRKAVKPPAAKQQKRAKQPEKKR